MKRGVAVLLVSFFSIFASGSQLFVGEFLPPPATNSVHLLKLNMPDDGVLQIKITTSPTLSFALATVGLFDSDKATRIALLSVGAGASTTREFGQLRGGDYFLSLWPSGGYGAYEVEVNPLPAPVGNDPEPNDTPGEAKPFALGQNITGHIGFQWQGEPYDRNDYWKFTLPEDGAVEILFDAALNYLIAEIRDTSGAIVTAGTGIDTTPPACSTCTNLLAPRLKAGNYILRLGEGYAGVTWGSYTFKLNFSPTLFPSDNEPNDVSTLAQPAQLDTDLTGHLGYLDGIGGVLESIDYADWWILNFPHGGDLPLALSASSDLQMTFEMFASDGVTRPYWRSVSKSESTNVVVRNLSSGTYLIKASALRFYWGSYGIRFDTGIWATWLEQFFSDEEIRLGVATGYAADPDNDGIKNLAEFAFGQNPVSPESMFDPPRIQLTHRNSQTYVDVIFERPRDRASVLKYSLARNDSLPGRWGQMSVTEEILADQEGIQTVRFSDPDPATFVSTRFYQIWVEIVR